MFTGNPTEEKEYMQQDLKDIEMRIVEKCNSLPLAFKTIAGVLRTKNKRRSVWKKVLETPSWSAIEFPKSIMGAFYLSYENLISHLKYCFFYFSRGFRILSI